MRGIALRKRAVIDVGDAARFVGVDEIEARDRAHGERVGERLIAARLVHPVERFDALEIVLSRIADGEQPALVADHRALERREHFAP